MSRKKESLDYKNMDKDSLIDELKKANRRLKSDNERLKSEVHTLKQYFKKTSEYLNNKLENVSLEDIIAQNRDSKNSRLVKQVIKEADIKCSHCGVSNITKLSINNVGILMVCKFCKTRKLIKNEKEKE